MIAKTALHVYRFRHSHGGTGRYFDLDFFAGFCLGFRRNSKNRLTVSLQYLFKLCRFRNSYLFDFLRPCLWAVVAP
jgi:hypothetical protein